MAITRKIRRLRLRGGTSAEWAAANTVLAEREPAWDSDVQRIKVGDGVTPWLDLPWATGGVAVLDNILMRIGVLEAVPATTWSNLPGKPSVFPPDVHHHVAADITDLASVIAAAAGDGDAATLAQAKAYADAIDVDLSALIALAEESADIQALADAVTALSNRPPDVTQAELDAEASARATGDTSTLNAAASDAQSKADAAQNFAKQRANHTGTQAISTVVGLQAALDARAQVLLWDGSAYPAKTAAQAIFVGPSDPNNLGLMGASDVWIDTVPDQGYQVDTFPASGIWTKPVWANTCEAMTFGAGGGGGGGAQTTSGTACSGGAGGGAGGWTHNTFLASALGATETVTVGVGGAGGVGRTTSEPSTAGRVGASGSVVTSFGTWINSTVGGAGTGGQFGAASTAGAAGAGHLNGAAGGAGANGANGAAGANGNAGGGGGAGGGISVTPARFNGGAGGRPGFQGGNTASGGTAAILGHGTSAPNMGATGAFGFGGGGGASSITGTAGNGGDGSFPGGGGGGGGSSLNGFASGAGGKGGDGLVIVISRA